LSGKEVSGSTNYLKPKRCKCAPDPSEDDSPTSFMGLSLREPDEANNKASPKKPHRADDLGGGAEELRKGGGKYKNPDSLEIPKDQGKLQGGRNISPRGSRNEDGGPPSGGLSHEGGWDSTQQRLCYTET